MCNIRKAEVQENKHKFHAKKQKPSAKQTFVKRAIAILVCKAENSKRNRYGKILPTNPGWIMDQFISFSEFSRNYPWFVGIFSDDFAFDFHLSTLSNCLYVIGIAKQTFKGTIYVWWELLHSEECDVILWYT